MITLNINMSAVIAQSEQDEIPLPPAANQYLEMRATKIQEVEGKGKQVIFELYGHNLEFKAFDVRFSYDENIFKTSNILTNDETEDAKQFFKPESDFENHTELFTLPQTQETTDNEENIEGSENNENETTENNETSKKKIMRAVFSFNPPVEVKENGPIINKEGIGKVVSTGEELLIGKVSFSMNAQEFDISSFKLERGDNFPTTGIDINLDGTHCFEEQSTFKFVDKTASKDAYLSNLIVSSGEIDENNPENSTYKEYELVPTFEKETTKYELTLMEYIDILNIKVTQNDIKSTIKMKVPKRDENNKLQYEEDGQTIIYEEKEIQNNINEPVTINKLGEPDTLVTIIVTAEDGKTINNYELTVKRPCGLIKGSIYTSPTANTTKTHKATVRIYKTDEVNNFINWNDIIDGMSDNVHDILLTLNSLNVETNDDGTYEIYVIPGTYDILLDKPGYLDHIITAKQINDKNEIEIERKSLLPRRYK